MLLTIQKSKQTIQLKILVSHEYIALGIDGAKSQVSHLGTRKD